MKTIEKNDADFLMQLGTRVRDIRKGLALSQEQLSEIAGVHPTTVSHVEGGKVNLSVCIIRRLANALQMPLVQLLDITQTAQPDELMKTVIDIKSRSRKEQKLILETIKGMLSGMKE